MNFFCVWFLNRYKIILTIRIRIVKNNNDFSQKTNTIAEKTKNFAIQIIHLYLYLSNERKEYVLSKQVLRSGTSIGANVKEATQAQSKADFISKMSIALKEASFLNEKQFNEINKENESIIKIITKIIKTSKTTPTKN